MDFIEELEWRGIMNNSTPGIAEALQEGIMTGYIGFDPTAPSMTIGNFVQIQLLKLFQLSGHTPIVLMGGATGRVGDPSGKDKERQLKSFDELDRNLAFQKKQFYKFLDFEEGVNKATIVNNYDFYKDMNVLDFLRDIGKTLTINYMMSKESVKKRVETGLSFTEFSYQLLQAYDFQCLYKEHNCMLQIGGSDQWGNITSGTEFIRRNLEGKAYAITSELLTKTDGSKFGKSEGGNIWLDPNMTSPYKFYQFWLNADDADVPKFFRFFTLKSREEVEKMEVELADNLNEQKRILAEELTVRVHSQEAFESAKTVSALLFNKKANEETCRALDTDALATVAEEIPSFEVPKSAIEDGLNIVELLAEKTSIVTSKGDARRALKGNAISVNKVKISDPDFTVSTDHMLQDQFILIDNGKKNKFILKLV